MFCFRFAFCTNRGIRNRSFVVTREIVRNSCTCNKYTRDIRIRMYIKIFKSIYFIVVFWRVKEKFVKDLSRFLIISLVIVNFILPEKDH